MCESLFKINAKKQWKINGIKAEILNTPAGMYCVIPQQMIFPEKTLIL